MAIGSPSTLLTTRTAAAPAFWASRILVEKVQIPREIRAILTIRLPPGRAEQAVLKPLVVPTTTPSGAVRSAETVTNWPAAAPKGAPFTVAGAPTECGAVPAPAGSARPPAPGGPTGKRAGAALPAVP